MSGDPLDLDAIEAMVRRGALYDCDALTLALVAEVRRLRARDATAVRLVRRVITRCLMEDGEDRHSVEATSGMSLIEALGMLRLAESTLLEFPPGADDDGEDEA